MGKHGDYCETYSAAGVCKLQPSSGKVSTHCAISYRWLRCHV